MITNRIAAITIATLAGASASLAGPAVVGVDVVAQEGGTLGGLTITNLNAPNTNGLGGVGFTFAVDNGAGGTTNGFASFTAALLQDILFFNTDVTSNVLTGAETTSAFGNNGEFIFSPSVDGEDSVWGQNGLILRADDAVPGNPGVFSSFNSRPSNMQPDGTAYWVGGVTNSAGGATQGRALWRYDGATYTSILQTGDVIEGQTIGTTGVGFSYDLSDDGANHIHVLLLDTGSTADDAALYVNGAIVAREQQSIGSENWDNFDAVSINTSGNYIFSGDTDGATATDEFLAYNGAISIREGDSVGGVILGSSVNAASINNLNQAAFIWNLDGTGEGLFFAADASDLGSSALLLQVGDSVDLNNDGVADATLTNFTASNIIGPGLQFSDNPFVYVEVDLTDLSGAEFEAIIRVAVPAPGAAGLLAFAGLAATRRRRR
jgi:hypothetical protein